jgi:hypothetical protein
MRGDKRKPQHYSDNLAKLINPGRKQNSLRRGVEDHNLEIVEKHIEGFQGKTKNTKSQT